MFYKTILPKMVMKTLCNKMLTIIKDIFFKLYTKFISKLLDK